MQSISNANQQLSQDAHEGSLLLGSTERRNATSSDAEDSPTTIKDANPAISRTRALFSVLGLGLLVILQAMNMSIITTAQGSIAKELHALEETTWFNSAFLIAMSAMTPISGKLSGIFQPRWCIFASALVAALGCAISSLATGSYMFILGRVVSGIGASGVLTISLIVVLELSGAKMRGLSMGLLNSGITFGVAAGALVAGVLVSRTGWRSLFYLQIPIAMGAAIVLLSALPPNLNGGSTKDDKEFEAENRWRRLARIDYVGALLLTISIVLMLYSLSAPTSIPIIPLLLSPFAFAVFIWNELHWATDPIVPLSLLKSRGMLMSCLSTGGYMMARWTVLFYTPTYGLAVRGWPLSSSGAILFPTNLGFALGGLLVGWLHIRRDGAFYYPSIVALTINPCTLVALAALATASSPAWAFIIAVFVNGVVSGASLNYTLAHVLHITPKSTHNVATSLVGLFRGFAGSFGSAIGGGLFLRRLRASLEGQFLDDGMRPQPDFVRRVLGSPEDVSELTGKEHVIAVRGYEDALKFLWLTGAGLAAMMVVFQALTGQQSADEGGVNQQDLRDVDED